MRERGGEREQNKSNSLSALTAADFTHVVGQRGHSEGRNSFIEDLASVPESLGKREREGEPHVEQPRPH